MSAEAHVLLAEAEGVPLGDQDLLAHQIDARHRLGDRVLHLNARVHLEEIEAPVGVEQELDGPRASYPMARAAASAASVSRARSAASTAGDGASSTTFWCRR